MENKSQSGLEMSFGRSVSQSVNFTWNDDWGLNPRARTQPNHVELLEMNESPWIIRCFRSLAVSLVWKKPENLLVRVENMVKITTQTADRGVNMKNVEGWKCPRPAVHDDLTLYFHLGWGSLILSGIEITKQTQN